MLRPRRTGWLRLGCRKAPQITRKELARSGEAAGDQPHKKPRSPWSWKTNGHAEARECHDQKRPLPERPETLASRSNLTNYADFTLWAAAMKLSVAAEFVSLRRAMPTTSGGGAGTIMKSSLPTGT